MKLEVGMYVRGKYYSYRGKIGKIIKNYQNELEIAYENSIVKTSVSSFIEDNFDINGQQYKASHNIIDLIEVGDYVNGSKVLSIDNYLLWLFDNEEYGTKYIGMSDIKSIVTKEQFESMAYKVGD